jgi:hypothetical protein
VASGSGSRTRQAAATAPARPGRRELIWSSDLVMLASAAAACACRTAGTGRARRTG